MVLTAIALLVTNTWLVEGLAVPLVVQSGSMEPVLLGPHRHWNCQACASPFDCAEESLGRDFTVVCPHCQVANDPNAGARRTGGRVWVDRSAFAWRWPRRGEVVVFRSPQAAHELAVKRIVGLPGETVRIDGKNSSLGANDYFVLGDNRESSTDSRHWPESGIDASQIVGRAIW